MKEIPILFNGEMVRAILDGRKTQTRRPFSQNVIRLMKAAVKCGEVSDFIAEGMLEEHDESYILQYCPYGQPGDILWVRETWQTTRSLDHCKPSNIAPGASIQYAADRWNKGFGLPEAGKLRPSIFMMPWMSRLKLRVKSVRVQRVQDITEEDAFDEGMTRSLRLSLGYVAEASEEAFNFTQCRDTFRLLWNATYKNWDANPWVWAIEFERVNA